MRLGVTYVALCVAVGVDPAGLRGQMVARRSDFVAEYHGREVADPYRWMENMTSPEVMSWARSQDGYARHLLGLDPGHATIRRAVAAAADHDRFTSPVTAGGRRFYARLNSSATRVDIMVREEGADRILVDAGVLAAAGLVANALVWPSPGGRLVAFGVMEHASRWMELRVRDVATGQDLPDRIPGLQGQRLSNVSWAADGSGIFYDRYDGPPPDRRTSIQLTGSRTAFHRLGDDPGHDVTLVRATGDGAVVSHQLTDDGRWLVVSESDGATTIRLLVIEATPQGGRRVELVRDCAAIFSLVGSTGDEVWLYTNLDASNGRVVSVDLAAAGSPRWTDIVPQRPDPVDTWTGAKAVGDRIVVGYRHRGRLELRMFDPAHPDDGVVVPLPKIGSVWFGVTGLQEVPEFFYVLSDFADPGTVYRYDLRTGRSAVFLAPRLPYDPSDFVTSLVYYRGPAGDSIPMYVAHRRDLRPDGTHPVMIYGYAFGNWSVSPWFRAHMAEWFQGGGIFALPALRGGGEFGQAWADAGLREHRQNAVDDYVAAARWLVVQGMARPELLVAETNSAGASVVGAAVLQNPKRFGAVIVGFPLLDLLRYEAFTGGRRWRSQLGSVNDPRDLKALLAYSPVQNAERPGCYPPFLVLPGEDDETTPPFHAYKFVAALQHAQTCTNPVLLRVSWGAGHAYGRDQEATVDDFADQLSFLRRVLKGWAR